MNTIENNKLIAEFLGIKDEIERGENSIILLNGIIDYHKIDNLKFHSDWDWLMEVVEKIESLNVTFSIDGNKCYCLNDDFCNAQKESTKIYSVYKVCVEFIKWYNEQKK